MDLARSRNIPERWLFAFGNKSNCTHCGGETRVIGYDTSEVLDREPAKWFVRITKREKRSCGKCSAIPDAATCASHRGARTGQRPRDHRNGDGQVWRPPPLYCQEAMIQTRSWRGNITRGAGRLGDAGGRVAGTGSGSDAPWSAHRILYTGR
ncbi:MAG: IS66 family transposase zinc-finger binding domain-containing protein [Bryobacterales bacterium]|nr:IS66 family transposase zinc-finger binding domain-containing protein [Bryobacterales bacterium]